MASRRVRMAKYSTPNFKDWDFSVAEQIEILSRHATEGRLERLQDVLDRRDWGLLLVCDRIRNPHNTSALLRSAEALGLARAMVVDDREPDDPGYKLCRGVTLGAQKWLPVEFLATVEESIDNLRTDGYEIVVADNIPEAVPMHELRAPGRVALVVGSELTGLHDAYRQAATHVVKIPTYGLTTSFNVSCAGAVLLQALRGTSPTPREPVPDAERPAMFRDCLRRSVKWHERILKEERRRRDLAAGP